MDRTTFCQAGGYADRVPSPLIIAEYQLLDLHFSGAEAKGREWANYNIMLQGMGGRLYRQTLRKLQTNLQGRLYGVDKCKASAHQRYVSSGAPGRASWSVVSYSPHRCGLCGIALAQSPSGLLVSTILISLEKFTPKMVRGL